MWKSFWHLKKNGKYAGNRKELKEAERAAKQAAEEAARMQEEALRHPGKSSGEKAGQKSSPLSYRASNCDGSGGNSYLYGKC